MDTCTIRLRQAADFIRRLEAEERSAATREKYLRDVSRFILWLEERPLGREAAAGWKAALLARGYAPGSINSMLAAVNRFLTFLGRPEWRAKPLRIQRRPFQDRERELTRAEYGRLLAAARGQGRRRLSLLMEAVRSTGIRVSEVRFLTVEAIRRGRAEVALKGKIRTILLPRALCRKLLGYARDKQIASGEIFLTRGGNPLPRQQIWAEMKSLCAAAGVARSKVFPHNLRHLFARVFYQACRDVVKLADVLGHSSVDTTRIYLRSTGAEHVRLLESLGLLST